MRTMIAVIFLILVVSPLGAQEEGTGGVVLEERDRLIRERYEQVLQRDPLQDAAFNRVYESYMLTEGVDAWLARLKPAEGQAETAGGLVLQGRILARQFKTREAVEALSKARELGESSAAFNALLGRLYYETGKDDDAVILLGAALDATESPEQRSELCRILGSVYLRSGKRAEAAAVWERIAELNPNDLFALQELAEICEENHMWDEAIAARQRIIAAASNDPYRQCHAWRAIGQSLLAKDDHAGAIAAFEQGLALAAPGNWLHEDLKGRLVGVYESRGDLEGLAAYLEARTAQEPTDLSLSELLADVSMRREDLARAESLLKDVIARSPGRVSALEMLISLYRRADRMDDVAATFEVLIAQYPAEPDYLRRLGEAWLEQKAPEKALETWRRVVGDGSKAGNHAQLAEWLERSEFFPEASAAYEAALAIQPDREWHLRLASLKYDMGEEDAALAAWQAAVAPDDTPAGEVAEIAAILLSKEFKAEAEALYARAMGLEPDNLDHVLAYARLLTAREDHAGAVAQYTRLAEQDTSEYLKNEGERGLLDAYEALGTLDQQRTAWEEAIAQAPGDTTARLKLARLYARLGNRPGVVKLYEECVAIDPARIEFQRLLAAAYKENRQSEKAIEVIEGLMAKDAERSQAYLRDLLALYGTSGRPQDAIRSAEKLVELSPSSPEARTALAQAYLRNGEPEKGLQQYRNLVQLDSTQPAYFREFGDALQQFGSFGEAQEVYRKMLEAATDDNTRLDAVNRLAAVYVRNGQRDVLLSEFQRRVSAAPKSLAAYQELAAVYRAAGDLRSAMETLERAQGEVEDRDTVLRLVMTEAYQAGDHQKVLAVYEELLARSAQPTPQDLDRLAGAYAQVGRMDDAITVWERIAKENPDDAAVQLQVARQFEAYGLYEEANARTERALEIDPYDYDLRFDYAQQLIGFNEVDKGLEQLKKILDIGERPEAPSASGASQTPTPQSPATFAQFYPQSSNMMRNSNANMGMNMNMSMPYRVRGGFGGRSRRYGQSFSDVRQQVVQTMVHLSRQLDDAESMVDTYRKRIEAQPENIDARRDYLLVCEASEQLELALEAARELSALQPEDLALRWQIFGYLQQLDRKDEAIAMAKALSQQPDANLAGQARLMHIRMLAESERYSEAEAVLAEVTADAPEKAQIYLQVAASFQRAESPETADQLYQKAAELDPRFLNAALTGRARLRHERGDAAGGRALYIEAVFVPAAEVAQNMFRAQRNFPTPLYMPQGARRGRQSGNNVSMLQGYNFPMTDHQRAEALNEAYRLTSTPEEFAPVIERLRAEAEKYVTAESDEARQEASNFVYFYVACLRNTDRDSEAVQAVEALLARRPGDFLLQNLRLFLLDEQGRFDEMRIGYAEIETSNPALAGEVARARLQLALSQEDIAALPALYRALPDTPIGSPVRGYAGMRANQLSQVVRTLENGGARAEARALLEEELARSRDAGILVQLSRFSAAEHRYDEAIAYAREAYEKQGAVRGRGPNYQYTMNAMSLQTQGLYGLETLWSAYREAGREQELIADFEARLEGQPTSVTLRQSLIGLYMESNQYDLARSQMEKLLELRPNDIQLKVRYAGLLESNNDPAGALAVLESVAAARPSVSRNISGEIRRLYKDLGKKDELAALQERIKREARSVNELQELAQQLGQEREYLQAAELLQRALRIEPQNVWLVFQIGDYYWQAGNKNEAAAEYLKLYQPTSPQAGIQVDTGRTPEIIGRIAEAGRLEELKAIAAATHSDEYTARSLKILEALIARHEGRAEEAEQLLKSIATANADHQVSTLLAGLAEARGDLAAAIQYLESAGKVAGQTDYQRLAMLYLRAGDSEKSLQTWKKFAEQHGGNFGHDQAIRALSEAGAHDVLVPYFKEVFTSIPASDPARHQLAESLIGISDDSGRYDSLIDSEIFSTEMKTTPELARRYAGDLENLPGLARRRVAPIAARFPENRELQALYADTLQKSGDVAGAIAVYEKLPRDTDFYKRFGDRFATLLREAGEIDAWCEFVLSRARHPNPYEGDVKNASWALIESGRRGELAAFREEVLANSESGQHGRLRASFAEFDAERGDVAGARATLKSLMEDSNDSNIKARYLQFLIVQGFQTEAGQQYAQWPEEVREAVFQEVRSRGVMGALLAGGNTEAAWRELMRGVLRRRAGHDPGGYQIAEELGELRDFCRHVVPASVVDGYIDTIRKQPVLSRTDRFVLAWWEINRGHWSAALASISDYRKERMYQELLERSKDLLPQDLRQETLENSAAAPAASSEAEAVAATPEATPQSRIEEARDLAENGKAEEAIALLDAVSFSNADADMLQRRAEAYRAANAPEKAAADLTVLLAQHPDYRNVRVKLAEYLALAGKPAEAMAAWREAGQPVNTEFGRVLLDKSCFAEALEVLGTSGTQGGWAVDVALLRARALEGTGQIEAMVGSLESVYHDLNANGQEGLVLQLGTQLEKSAIWHTLLGMDTLKSNAFVNHVLLSMTRNMNPDEAGRLRDAMIARIDPLTLTRRDDAENFSLVLRESGQRDQAIAVLMASAKLPRTSPHSDRVLVDALYNLEARNEAAGMLIELSRTDPAILTRDPAYGLYRAEELEDPAMRDALFDRIIELAPTDALATYATALKAWHGPDKAAGQAALVAFADAPEAQSPHLFRLADLFREQGEDALALKCLERLAGGDFGDEVQDRALLTQISFKQKAGDPAGALEVFSRLLPAPLPMRSQAWQEIAAYLGELPYESVEPLIVARIQANPEHPGVGDLAALRAALASRHSLPVSALDLASLGVPAAREAELRLFGNLITTWAASDIAETTNWSEMARELDAETAALLRGEDVPLPPSREWRALEGGDSFPSLLVGRMSGGFSGAWGIRGASEFLVKLESPDVRTVTLAIGSSDQIRLWVNEGEVYSNRSGRLNFLDTDRVDATLKQGANWVFVRCRHGQEASSGVFSLSIVSGAEGLRVLMPSLPAREKGRADVQAAQ